MFVHDVARALAALVVLAAHARTAVFEDAPGQALGPAADVFFGVTGLGHQAVAVFLVISGTLVTRSMRAMHDEGRWSPARFALLRLARLWPVLLPCLVLGGLDDLVALALGGTPNPGVVSGDVLASHLGLGTLVGNVFFLQGRLVPSFGSNAPLWTLSIEAWCYALGFTAFGLARRPSAFDVLALVTVAAGVSVFLGWTFWALLPVWLMGSAVALAGGDARQRGGLETNRAAAVGTALLIASTLLISRLLPARFEIFGLYGVGAAAAVGLRQWSEWTPQPGRLRRLATALAAVSYSLYLSHAPLIALLCTAVIPQHRLRLTDAGIALWTVLVALCLTQAVLVWWLFERHTPRFRALIGKAALVPRELQQQRAMP